jgi:hypothetical protein
MVQLLAGEAPVKTHLPSLRALQTSDDEQLHEEFSLLAVREQVAIVRALADELERLTAQGRMRGRCEQFVEELARLGCRILETAATASQTTEPTTSMGFRSTGQNREASPHGPRAPKRESGLRLVETPSPEVFR